MQYLDLLFDGVEWASGQETSPKQYDAPPRLTVDTAASYTAIIRTSSGIIAVDFFAAATPITVNYFVFLANEGFFEGTIFHRVIPGFVIQGGGLASGMQEKQTGTPIQNEADNGLKNLIGAICMARTNDPHSATSQFFINLKDNHFLDHTEKTESGWGYAVFGRVVSGMDVVEKVAAVDTGNAGYHSDVPLEDVVLEKAERVTD